MKCLHQASGENWHLYHGDSAEVLQELPENSIALACYSPPFSSLYTYQASERDVGNCADHEEFFRHYSHIEGQVRRLLKPGRRLVVHAMDLAILQFVHGYQAVHPFTDDLVRFHIEQGWRYVGRVMINVNPQVQAIRLHSKQLLFVQLGRDRAALRPALPQQLLLFEKPGTNAVPIVGDEVSRDEWIKWASPIWTENMETDTLNAAEARGEEDEKHTCPLSLSLVERVVRLWSNPGEVVLDPFNGIGSTGYVSLLHGRRYLGVELKRSYWEAAVRNLKRAEEMANQPHLFSGMEEAFR